MDFFSCLDVLRRHLRPVEYSLKPLSPDRDVLPNSRRVYSLTLTYKFNTTEKNTNVSPKFPAFSNLLYDSYFEDFFAIGKYIFFFLNWDFVLVFLLIYF